MVRNLKGMKVATYSSSEISKQYLYLGLVIGLISLPLYAYGGSTIKIFLTILVFFQVISKRVEFLPGLILHLVPETISMYGILLGTLFITLINSRYWVKSKLKWIYLLSLVPFPIMLWLTYRRLFILNSNPVEILTFWGYYLGIFPFFYGYLLSARFGSMLYKALIYTLSIVTILGLIKIYPHTVRLVFYAIPFFFAFPLALFRYVRYSKNRILFTVTLIFMVVSMLNINAYSITVFFSIVFSILIIFFKKKAYVLATSAITSKWMLFGSIIIMLVIANVYSNLKTRESISNLEEIQTLRVTNISELKERIKIKAFADRGPIWAGVITTLKHNKNWLPPDKTSSYRIETITGAKLLNVDTQSHNIYLELLRVYGFFIGGIIAIILLYMLVTTGRAIHGMNYDYYLTPLISVAFAIGLVGGMVGQYPLLPSFSFLFSSILGLGCYNLMNPDGEQIVEKYAEN